MQHPNPEIVTLNDILITEELSQRASRTQNLQAENQAMRMLIHQMTQDAASLMQTLVDTALELCQAGTTGLSLLETTTNGEEIFRWTALAGTLAHHVGGSTPRNFSPCGVCLDQSAPVLFSHPERYFTYFQAANTPVVEGLVLPLIAERQVFGTIWIMSHDEQRQFDAEDVRIMTSLADFTATALLLQHRQTGELLAANVALETEIMERRQVEAQTHALIANLPGGAVFVVDRDLRYLLAQGEALSAAGFKSEDFVGRTIFEVLPPDLAASYESNYRQALIGEPFEHEHNTHNHIYISRGTPLRSPDGQVYAVLAVSFDITDHKRIEAAIRKSEEKYRSLFNSIDEGFHIIELIADEAGEVVDYRFLEGNPAFEHLTGLKNTAGKLGSEIAPKTEAHWLEAYDQVARTGESHRIENYNEDTKRWYSAYASRVGDVDSRQIAIAFDDITERKRIEANLAFLAEVSQDLVRLTSLDETMNAIGEKIGRFFDVKQCMFAEHADAFETSVATYGWNAADAPSLKGTYRTRDFLSGELMVALLTGEPLVVSETQSDGRVSAESYGALGIHSFIIVPLLRKGEWRFQISIIDNKPRDWNDDEIELMRELTNRIWTRLERARAEAAVEEDLRNTQMLRNLATRLVFEEDRQTLYQEIVKTAIALTQADAGSFQILDETTQELVLIETQGIDRTLTEHFYRLDASSNTSCGVALATGERTLINFDLPESEDPEGSHRLHRDAGLLCAQSTPLLSRSGKPIGMVSTHWREDHRLSDRELRFLDLLARQAADLIEQQQSQVVLRESEARLQSIANLVPDLLWDSEPDGTTNWYNQRWMEYTGQTFEQAIGWGWIDAIHPDDRVTSVRRYHEAVQQGVQLQHEHRIRRHDGEYRWFVVKASPLKDDGGRVVKMYGAATDIHDQRVALEALRESEERQQIALKVAKMGTFVWFPLEDRGKSDARMLAIFGLHEGDVLNLVEAIATMIHPDDLDLYAAAVTQAIAPGGDGKLYAEIRVIHPDTSLHWVAIAAQTYFEGQPPQPVRMYGIAADITSRKQAEANQMRLIQEQAAREQEQQRAESLAELDRAKTQFFSNISHEFRTPLTLLLAPLQDALSDPTLTPIHRERLELARRNSLRLLKLVNTLLDFSRIEAGRIEAVYEPTNLSQLTTDLASVFRSAIDRAGLRLIADCPPLPAPIYVDREMWEKIVLNLLSNALKFTFTGDITIRLYPDNQQAIFQIQDTGTGIAPEHLPHLFERFYQVRGVQAHTHEGSGIGLALVNELVQLQGGEIAVTSTVGEGTCFTIAIPFGTVHLPSERIQSTRTLTSTALSTDLYVQEAERWLPEESGRVEEWEGNDSHTLTSKILIVDDNTDMRHYLTRILSEYVQVEAVADGAAALAAIQAQPPDLILSDVMMPRLDGFGLLQTLRSDPRTREIPVILLSARAGEEAIAKGLDIGADDYLIKPFSAQELISRVNAHLQISHLRGEALHEARTASRRKDELLSVVSHELNTPLVSILGWTRLLRANPPNPAMLSTALDTIERSATIQAKLVQDLLDVSRITAGKLRLNLQPIDLKDVIEGAIATVTQLTAEAEIHLAWTETATAVVMGDRERLQQVVCNLLTNAIKFTPADGRIDVHLSLVMGQQPLAESEQATTNDNYAEIRVTDTGIGIEADFLPHVFEQFRQAEGTNSVKGLGLGLAIAHHIVELHNGTIQAQSAGEGQGSTFIIKLSLFQSNH